MSKALLALKTKLTSQIHTDRKPRMKPYDLDGACPACDHPFGQSNHMCIGPVTRVEV